MALPSPSEKGFTGARIGHYLNILLAALAKGLLVDLEERESSNTRINFYPLKLVSHLDSRLETKDVLFV